MDIYTLKLFLSAAQTLNFTKTAQEFYLTQPVVSRRISELESELGFTLFLRTSRGVSLTREGEILFPEVMRALKSLDDGIDNVQQYLKQHVHEINIAAITPATSYFLPAVIGEFIASNPDIEMHITRMTPNEIAANLSNPNFDIYISNFDENVNLAGFEHCFLMKHALGIVIHKQEPCETLEDALNLLRTRKILTIPKNDSRALNVQIENFLSENKITPIGVQEIRPIESLMFHIASGIGIGIMPEKSMSLDSFDLKYFPVTDHFYAQLIMLWRKDISALGQTFIDFLIRHIHKNR